jgi:membrane associated rhomboid family serine protease
VPAADPKQGDTIDAMSDAGGSAPHEEAGPPPPPVPVVDGEPGSNAPREQAERTHGLIIETCYRHPKVTTGVHCTRCGRPICPDCMRPAPVGYQCPECVAEARRSYPKRRIRVQFILGRPGFVTTALLAVNIAMFVVEVAKDPSHLTVGGGFTDRALVDLGGMVPLLVARQHQYWRLFTVMFLHADLLHIFFNMYALYLFGFLIENALGKARFVAIYFVSGFLASAVSYTFAAPDIVAVGASGAIFGLLGSWVAYNFRRRDLAANRFQLQWAGMLIAINLFLGFTIANIDNSAHIGGLLAGIACGAVAEGWGRRDTRRLVAIAGFALLIAVGVVLVATRTSALT